MKVISVLLVQLWLGVGSPFPQETANPVLREALRRLRTGPPPAISFTKYNTEQEIGNYVIYLRDRYPQLVTHEVIGFTHENRPIHLLRVTAKTGGNKPAILIDAGIHAREWVAPAVALFLLYQLVENYKNNKELVDRVEWLIIPLLNPDGYTYSMVEDRLWRKNRANTTDPHCRGVDLNRNFDIYFGGEGTSEDPCEETYVGKKAFSEPETRALRDFALRPDNSHIRLYMTLHSYGQYFLYPWGFGNILPSDWKDLDKLARVAEKALSSVFGTHYQVGSSTALLGPAAGGSDDWMKGKANIKYSYTVELPGGGEEGFDLPPENILHVATEMFEAIRLTGHFVAKGNRPPQRPPA